MLRALLLGLGIGLVGCATGSADVDLISIDGGRDGSTKDTGGGGGDGGCGVGLESCGGECVDLAFDRENCGTCGTKCAGTEVCKAGKCSSDCGTLTSCLSGTGATCVNTKTDAANCGACGKECPTGQLCSDGKCAPDCGTLTRCPGATPYCADTQSDVKNCGYCGNSCPAGQDCIAGVCQLACMPPTTKCGTECANTSTDPDHCGACGNACSLANATAGCSGGSCTVASCSAGFGNCDGNASNGCETNTTNNTSHCGSCGNACSIANGTAGCSGGSCTIASCNANYGNCDGTVGNGCETNLLTSGSHCGSCGNACPSGQSCQAGTCRTTTGTYNRTVSYSGSPYCAGEGICGVTAYACAGTAGISSSFSDPVPSGARVVTVNIRVYGLGCSGGTVTVRLNSTIVGTYSVGSSCSCGTCDAPYSVTLNNASGIPGYVYGGSNVVNIRAGASGMCTQRAEVTLTTG